jgi:rhodanese-related sulfurtransferase
LILSAILAVSTAGVAAQTPPAATADSTQAPVGATANSEARRISVAEAAKIVSAGKFLFVDVRIPSDYRASHIRGAVNIPASEIAERAGELTREAFIITYCTCPEEHASARAVRDLQRLGFSQVGALVGGMDAWMEAGFEPAVETSREP